MYLGECQHTGIKHWKGNLNRDGEGTGKTRSSSSQETKMIKGGAKTRVKQQRSQREDGADAD